MFEKYKRTRYKRLLAAQQKLGMRFDWLNRRRGIKVLHCFGDSHLNMFLFMRIAKILRRTAIRTTLSYSGTASGLNNPNSKTATLLKFKENLVSIHSEDYYLFLLGEVDCGSVIWYRAEKHNESVGINLERSLTAYTDFILGLNIPDKSHVIICSVPLPTIADGQTWGEVAKKRSGIKATLRERTDLTFEYNRRLRAFCAEHGMKFLDMEQDTLDQETQTVDKKFLNSDPLDHHMDYPTLFPLLKTKLAELGFE